MSCLVALALVAALPQQQHRIEDVRYPSGDITLAASVIIPETPGRKAAAVIVQGSGTSGRDNAWSRMIAEELADAGLVVLHTDKRGSGASGGDWRTADFHDLAADALAGVQLLRARPEVDPARVGVVGLSQGGWIVPIAAAGNDDVRFVIDIAGATVGFAQQSMHEMANTAREAGLGPDHVREVLELNRAAGDYLLGGDWQAYASARRQALDGPWREIAAGFPAGRDAPIWTFLKRVDDFDPMPYWLHIRQPVFVAFGAEDEHDNVPVAESVRRLEFAFASVGKQNYEVLVVPGVGHGLIDHTVHDLAPALVDALRAWLAQEGLR